MVILSQFAHLGALRRRRLSSVERLDGSCRGGAEKPVVKVLVFIRLRVSVVVVVSLCRLVKWISLADSPSPVLIRAHTDRSHLFDPGRTRRGAEEKMRNDEAAAEGTHFDDKATTAAARGK